MVKWLEDGERDKHICGSSHPFVPLYEAAFGVKSIKQMQVPRVL